MVEANVTIPSKVGLHARPASIFVQKANEFECEITVLNGNKEVNAKSILGVMSLGAGQGSNICIRAKGKNAQCAVDTLVKLVAHFAE